MQGQKNKWRRGHHLFHNSDLFAQPDCENKACMRPSHWHQQLFSVWATLHIGGNTEAQVWACAAVRRVASAREDAASTPDLDVRDVHSRSRFNQKPLFLIFLFFFSHGEDGRVFDLGDCYSRTAPEEKAIWRTQTEPRRERESESTSTLMIYVLLKCFRLD